MAQQQQIQLVRSRYTLDDILDKEQFKIKLNIRYYFFSGVNVVAFAIAYFASSSKLSFAISYLVMSLFGYKFVFGFTKDGKQYQPFLIKKAATLMRIIRMKNVRKK